MTLTTYFRRKNIRVKRAYISSALDMEIRKTKELLEQRFKRKYGGKGCLSYQASTQAVADRIRELRQNGTW
jgi:hypothetical protein